MSLKINFDASHPNMSDQETTKVLLIGVAVVAAVVGGYLLYKKYKADKDNKPNPPAKMMMPSQSQPPQRTCASMAKKANSAAASASMVQSAYRGQGPVGANTYTFSTAGPKYGATMGGLFDSLQPQHSVTAEFAGSFLAPGTRGTSC
jgi:hypothetical protein